MPPTWVVPAGSSGWILGCLSTLWGGEGGWLVCLWGCCLGPLGLLVHRRAGSVVVLVSVGALVGALRTEPPEPAPRFPGQALVARRVVGRVESVRVGGNQHGRRWVTLVLRVLETDRPEDGPRVGDGLRLSIGRYARSWDLGDELAVRVSPRRARGFCNAGRDSWVEWLHQAKIEWTAWVSREPTPVDTAGSSDVSGWVLRARAEVGRVIDRSVGPTPAAVLRALVLGDRARISPEIRGAFSRTGTAHLLAVSGLHVGLVALGTTVVSSLVAAYALCGGVGWPLIRATAPPVLLVTGAYVALSGGAVSTQRAWIMAAVALVASCFRRRPFAVGTLCVAADLLVLLDPNVLLDLSFQLSFAAVAAILFAGGRGAEARTDRWALAVAAWVRAGLRVSFVAGAATAPLVANTFGMVSVIGPFANLVVGPLLGAGALSFGLLGLLLVPIGPSAAEIVFGVAGLLVDAAVWVAESMAQWPGAAVELRSPVHLWCLNAAWVTCAVLFVWPRAGPRVALWLVAAAGVTAAASAWSRSAPSLELVLLDVGQGDALVVQSGRGDLWLIDGGGLGGTFDPGERIVVPEIERRGVPVRAAVLTHPDRDHYGGLVAVVERTPPREFWDSGAASSARGFQDLQDRLRAADVPRRVLERDGDLRLGTQDVEVEVLHPAKERGAGSRNDRSVVLSVRHGATRLLLAGDIERRGERRLRRAERDLAATVLKVAHHGSRSSSGESWMRRVRPALAVASLGAFNRFGFPAPEVQSTVRSHGGRWRDTGRWGALRVRSDGQLEQVEACRRG